MSSDNSSPRQQIINLFQQLKISPSEFCFRWNLDATELAQICGVSRSTTSHWLGGITSRREAGESYQRLLAIADVILENASEVEPLLQRWLNQRLN
ncbi:MAG: helix-turn-helix domain-containing protein [Halothece sp. Uz-M2-17]|nr:helix-turn-helix domain-containing protein [Halothece sp. Uz-M2-17]